LLLIAFIIPVLIQALNILLVVPIVYVDFCVSPICAEQLSVYLCFTFA